MKKIIISTFIFLAGFSANAQATRDLWRTFEVMGVPLVEKINLPLRQLPVELIRAYCAGNIKAYYPMDTAKECSYHEFVAHFNVGAAQPEGGKSADEFSGIPCPESFCNSNDASLLSNFLISFELLQTKRFDKNKSMEITEVRYVRLKYIYEKMGVEVVIDGPVFRYADIAALATVYPGQYKVQNPKNTAENFTIKKILDSRLFNGYVITPGKQKKYPENKGKTPEKDQWHH
jgi:hypothetical protein